MFALIQTVSRKSVRTLDKLAWSGPLIVRLTVGLVFVVSGWGKLHNLEQVTAFFTELGIPAPGAQAAFVSSVELVGGLLIVAGLATRIASALLIGVMAVAIWTAKWPEIHDVADLANTIEMAYLAMFVWLLVNGGGAISLDRLLRRWRGVESRVGVAPTRRVRLRRRGLPSQAARRLTPGRMIVRAIPRHPRGASR